MHDAGPVRRAHRVADLFEDDEQLAFAQGTVLRDVMAKAVAAEQLHREPGKVRLGLDAGGHHLHHVLALDPSADPRLRSNIARSCAS